MSRPTGVRSIRSAGHRVDRRAAVTRTTSAHRDRAGRKAYSTHDEGAGPESLPDLPLDRVTDGTRTRDSQDHNLVLYQLNYGHHCR